MTTETKRIFTDTELLERIAVALEALTLAYMDAHAPREQEPFPPLTNGFARPPAPPPTGPVGPEPPPLAPYTAPPPAVGPPMPYANPGYMVGSIHASGHKPLKAGRGGLFCPTKVADGSWCTFRVNP